MKLRSTLVALACLASLGSAQALTATEVAAARDAGTLVEVRLSGASALRLLIASYIKEDLAQAGTFDVFFFGNGADHRGYSFKSKVAIGSWPVGTNFLITKRDAGGSGQGVTPLLNGGDATQAHMLVNGSCTQTGASPATDIQAAGFTCTTTTQAKAHAGISDVEPALLQAPINNGTGLDVSGLDAAGFVQNIFGVAVNKKLYLALQKAQGLDSAGAINESDAATPSIPKSFITGALTGQLLGNSSSKKGWNLLIPASVDADVLTKRINVCRRTPGSGTQAASNVYFANNPCASGSSVYAPTAGTTTATLSVTGSATTKQGSSSQLVETCLADVDNLAGQGYAMGVLGRENNPRPVVNGVQQDKLYRFVKISGAAPTRAAVISGDYDFVVESSFQWAKTGAANAPSADMLALLTKMRTEMGKASVLATLDPDLQNGLVATPATILSGSWADLPAADKAFTAHTNRSTGNSCSPVRMTK